MNLINIYELYRKHANKNDEMLKDINSLINNHDISSLFKKYGILEEIRNLYTKHGIPEDHVRVFLEVAREQKAVISTRTPGPACGLLLKQGYDAKSFWVKSKSCDWGPMGGFVCLDPYLNKSRSKGALDNLAYTLDALTKEGGYQDGKHSTPIPLRINEARWQWLNQRKEKNVKKNLESAYYPVEGGGYHYVFGKYEVLLKKENDGFYYLYYDVMKLYGITNPSNLYDDICKSFDEKMRKYISKVEDDEKQNKADKQQSKLKKLGKYNEKFWKELKDKKYLDPQSNLQTFANGKFKHFRQLMAMTNAHKPYKEKDPHKSYEDKDSNQWHLNALTGDYDLFAIWPAVADDKLDSRVAGMTKDLIDEELIKNEEKDKYGKYIGNATQRIVDIATFINSSLDGIELKDAPIIKTIENDKVIKEEPLTLKANRVYHSDEAGRPFVDAVDSAVGFGPSGEVFEIRDKGDAPEDLSAAMIYFGEKGYSCFINKGWDKHLSSAARPYIKYNKILQ